MLKRRPESSRPGHDAGAAGHGQEAALPPHIRLGMAGEDAALSLLRRKGMRLLARNWRHGRLELDIVCEHNGFIVFVEVKTRRSHALGGPEGAITGKKKRNLVRAARAWLNENKAWNRPCRFDVVCLISQGTTFSAEHYHNAFDFTQTMDCGHSSWQPW